MNTSSRFFRNKSGLLLGAAVLPVCFLLSVFASSGAVNSTQLLSALWGEAADTPARMILFGIRIPRAVAAVCCGAGLSVSGLLLQESLNNRLASPGVIGVNSGAGLFVLIASLLAPHSVIIKGGAAFLGAVCAVTLVYLISLKAGPTRSMVVLAGVAVSSLMSAFSQGIISFWPETVTDKVTFSLGGLKGIESAQLGVSVIFTAAALAGALLLSGGIDLFPLGDEAAEGLGLNVRRYRAMAILLAAVLAGCAVSLCGLLSFVGLMIPNLIRIAFGENFRRSTVLCCLWGSSFLLLCDVIARSLFYPYELPAGLLLSCLGAPFFIWLLMRRKGEGSRA